MQEILKFSVMGDDDEIHEVTVSRDMSNSTNLTVLCTCSDAQAAHFCSHRFEVFEGDHANILSDRSDNMETLNRWVHGSDIQAAMRELSKAKSDLKLAWERVALCRDVLVRRMMD